MDARSLLRAKKAEAKIEHPYATYNASGVLRCSICAIPVKQWDAHLLTKQHRTSVAREKAEAAKAASKSSKRPAASEVDGSHSPGPSGSKRARVEASTSGSSKGLPEGFFSAGNKPIVDDESEGEEDEGAGPSNPSPVKVAPTGDDELDDFFASLDQPDPLPESTNYSLVREGASSGRRVGVLGYKDIAPGQASYEAAPVRNIPQEAVDEQEPEPEETEAEKRERIAREEREEIMGRLEEEERAQEDADSRVAFLKQRMEALRKKREGRTSSAKDSNPITKPIVKSNGA